MIQSSTSFILFLQICAITCQQNNLLPVHTRQAATRRCTEPENLPDYMQSRDRAVVSSIKVQNCKKRLALMNSYDLENKSSNRLVILRPVNVDLRRIISERRAACLVNAHTELGLRNI